MSPTSTSSRLMSIIALSLIALIIATVFISISRQSSNQPTEVLVTEQGTENDDVSIEERNGTFPMIDESIAVDSVNTATIQYAPNIDTVSGLKFFANPEVTQEFRLAGLTEVQTERTDEKMAALQAALSDVYATPMGTSTLGELLPEGVYPASREFLNSVMADLDIYVAHLQTEYRRTRPPAASEFTPAFSVNNPYSFPSQHAVRLHAIASFIDAATDGTANAIDWATVESNQLYVAGINYQEDIAAAETIVDVYTDIAVDSDEFNELYELAASEIRAVAGQSE